ncbi:hypothetical protein [Pseudarthrobacter sp. NIBRBAC000502770]|uniref:hypothetical protein n=1 Tax=Pseudarthrobacter sp. NIBRBAC000502770 TaxID=2590785 RepID=UPI00113FC951|nr:hypothetical protein [Pseudarthrobacter sp. NIBRBAC000502770]QDG89095.1 hypothetical protein NIBR502770_11865 [Pseudarthrobacter sp. NIBRBAC000502770]
MQSCHVAAGLVVLTLGLSGCAPWLPLVTHGPPPSPTLTGPAGKTPVTGQPSAQFCDKAEAYLARFPDVPLYRPDPPEPDAMNTLSCWYTSDILDPLKGVNLEAQALNNDDDRAVFTEQCHDGNIGPGSTRITAGWVTDHGWSAWIAQHDPVLSEAVLCTHDQFYSVRVSNVPGATADDALATIMAAID